MPRRSLASLGPCLLLPFVAAAVGALVGPGGAGGWYASIAKPAWTPPSWVFGPAWTTLYLLMGVALWLVWTRSEGDVRRRAVAAFGVQLALNAAWSPVFFGLHEPGWAFLVIVLLWGAIVATVFLFLRTVRAAGLLLLPYLGWVTFAAALNFAIWRLNAG
jgi:tryptophan-rich sensory protein